MRVLVCGGRTFDDAEMLDDALDEIHATTPITLVIEGGAAGADTIARYWARRHGITCETYRADWKRYGNRAAGPIRNKRMLDEGMPDLVVAVPGGTGTADMIKKADKANVPVKAYPVVG